MKPKYLLAAAAIFFVVGCIDLANQYGAQPMSPIRISGSNPEFGGIVARADMAAVRHSERIAQQGQSALDQKQYERAEILFRKALKINPKWPYTWLQIAEASEGQGHLEHAVEAYHTFIYWQPSGWIDSVPNIHMHYVLALTRCNRYAEAVQVYDEARRLAAHDSYNEGLFPLRFDAHIPNKKLLQAAAHYVMGVSSPYYRTPPPEEIKQHLQAAMRLAPDWGKPFAAMGTILDRRNHPLEAEVYYAKARNLGETVESCKQESERIFAKMKREHDVLHPEIPSKDAGLVSRYTHPTQGQQNIATMLAIYAEDVPQDAAQKRK